MSSTKPTSLASFSEELVSLAAKAAKGVAAVKSAPYRVVSGVAIAGNLLAVTDHSLKREERIGVVLPDGQAAHAKLVGRAPGIDVAVLDIEKDALHPLPASTAELNPGALAAVVGSTADVGTTVSLGILGAVGGERKMWRGGSLDRFLRLDVNLYPSQSGAAVVDVEGGLIGLATPALLRHSSVAVPFATLKRLANELAKDGRIRQGYLGIGVQPVAIPAKLREKAGITGESGLMLLSVEPGSPAEESGMQLGDILLSLGGRTAPDVEDLQEILRGEAVGKSLEAVAIRGGEVLRLQVSILERAASERKGQ